MSAPLAFDADKEEIDVRLRVEGREVVLGVPHRGGDLRYPVVVDPVYENQDSWRYGNPNAAGWRYYEQVPQFPHAFGDYCCGVGFYIWRNPNQWFARGWFAEYQYFSPTVWSYIHRADFMHVRHAAYATNTTQGMWSTTLSRHQHQYTFGYSFDWANNYYSVCADGGIAAWQCDEYVDFGASRGNYVQSSLWAAATGAQPHWAWNYFGGARIWMSDPEPPTALYVEGMPSGWVHDVPARGYSYNPNQAHVRFGDRGLGMWGLWMDVPGRGRQYSADWAGCSGAQSARCPESRAHTFSLAGISEGVQTVTTTGQDVLGRTSSASKTVKVDRTGPTVEAAGELREASGSSLVEETYDLSVAATDPLSGVGSVQVKVDGVVKATAPGACSPSGCATRRPLDFTLRPDDLQPGTRTITVTAKDQAGNVPANPLSWTVKVDDPRLELSGSLVEQQGSVIKHDRPEVLIQAEHSHGMKRIEVLLDGQRVDYAETPCPPSDEVCVEDRSYEVPADQLAPGGHSLTVVATDGQLHRTQRVVSFQLGRASEDDPAAQAATPPPSEGSGPGCTVKGTGSQEEGVRKVVHGYWDGGPATTEYLEPPRYRIYVDVHGVSGRRGGFLLSRIRALAAGRWDGARRGGRVRVPAARPAGAWGRVCRGVRRWRRG